MTVAEAEAARRPSVALAHVEAEAPDEDPWPWQDLGAVADETAGPVQAEVAPTILEPPALLPAAQDILPGAPPPLARPVAAPAALAPVAPVVPVAPAVPVAPVDSLELLDWFDTHGAVAPAPAQPPVAAAPAPVEEHRPESELPGSELPGSALPSSELPVQATAAPVSAAALILTQPTPHEGPRVELGFRDGSRAELDPAGEQAQALEELARTLTGF